jgi:hypothetical protein
MTVIPEGNMQPIKIDITGTIAGSGYTALRTALADLRRALETGKESFYIDNERYCRVLSKSFDYGFITSDFANYNISFIGELPYFLAGTASSDIRGIAASAATYAINNAGDINVPVKLTIKAPAGGIPAGTNIVFENKTTGLYMAFTGALSATQTLVVDCGYDNNNVPTFLVQVEGVDAMSAFQGDFISAQPGTNYMGFTGTVNGTVSLYWRGGYYA